MKLWINKHLFSKHLSYVFISILKYSYNNYIYFRKISLIKTKRQILIKDIIVDKWIQEMATELTNKMTAYEMYYVAIVFRFQFVFSLLHISALYVSNIIKIAFPLPKYSSFIFENILKYLYNNYTFIKVFNEWENKFVQNLDIRFRFEFFPLHILAL